MYIANFKISPTYPWKIPQTLRQQFLKEFLSFGGFGEVWGIFPGHVGKIIDKIPVAFDPMDTNWSSCHLKCYELRDNAHDHPTLLPGDGFCPKKCLGVVYRPKLGEMIQFY